jgi:hypothetical protein
MAILGTLGLTCSLVYAMASTAIWTVSSSRELYFPLYYVIIFSLHQANIVL